MTTHCNACNVDSTTSDFCDQCGAALISASSQAASANSQVAPLSPGSSENCPICSNPRVANEPFCEACGYDFVAKSAPQAAVAQPAQSSQSAQPAASATAIGAAWWATATCDEAWYNAHKVDYEGVVSLPSDYLPRSFPLTDKEIRIGRRATGGFDLSAAPKDDGVSGEHAVLVLQVDGSYQLIDHKSTNGTFINGGSDALAKGVATTIADGDFINIGAWTRITFQKR